ncbi:MAG: Sir2 family NAD-dependent protein deacetylase [Acidobacteriota bacterium]
MAPAGCPNQLRYSSSMAILDDLAAAWRSARRPVVLTGAGLSTASGIPDFRSPGGRWSSYQPVTIQEFESSAEARAEYWRYKGETWRVIERAEPNPAHRSLRVLADTGHLDLLVTQNVDGLHERSGFPEDRLVNIHGTDSATQCLACGRREPRGRAQKLWEDVGDVPRCDCGGWLKPATISFGQSLVMADLSRAFQAAQGCDFFAAIGTSLVVAPIHQMLPLAVDAGAQTAILTASETPFDDAADWKLSDPVQDLLPAIAELVAA